MSYDPSKWDIYYEPPTGHPIEKHTRVHVIYYIRRVADGEVRQYRTWDTYDPEDGDAPGDYMYSEGNYSCDCNRHIFFSRANGEEPNEDRPCGDVLYELNVANAKTGEVFYREFDIPALNTD